MNEYKLRPTEIELQMRIWRQYLIEQNILYELQQHKPMHAYVEVSPISSIGPASK